MNKYKSLHSIDEEFGTLKNMDSFNIGQAAFRGDKDFIWTRKPLTPRMSYVLGINADKKAVNKDKSKKKYIK